MYRKVAILIGAVFVLLSAGCRQSAAPTATPNPDIQIDVENLSTSQKTGSVTLVVVVRDAAGTPLDGARVEARGDMNHAGMVPSLGSAEGGQNGRYEVPLAWTMAGDWFLDVTVTLPDGRSATRRFDLTVAAS